MTLLILCTQGGQDEDRRLISRKKNCLKKEISFNGKKKTRNLSLSRKKIKLIGKTTLVRVHKKENLGKERKKKRFFKKKRNSETRLGKGKVFEDVKCTHDHALGTRKIERKS